MKKLSVTNASRIAGVSRQTLYEQIKSGEIKRSSDGIDVSELMRAYPKLKSLAGMQENTVESTAQNTGATLRAERTEPGIAARPVQVKVHPAELESTVSTVEKTLHQAGTVELLVRELEWNKELLEKTNQLMAKQLADQRSLIADQARRLDEKDRFWARQIEIAQSLLPAPTPVQAPRKRFLGIF